MSTWGIKTQNGTFDDIAELYCLQNHTVLRTNDRAYTQKMISYQGMLELHTTFKVFQLQRLDVMNVLCAVMTLKYRGWVKASDQFVFDDLKCEMVEPFLYLALKSYTYLCDVVVDMLYAV